MTKSVVKQENIVEKKESAVPVEPSLSQFSVYGITPPSEFALYGTGSKELYESEVERVTAELRRMVFNDENVCRTSEALPIVEKSAQNKAEKKAKNCNGFAIWAIIASILLIALYIVGKYVTSPISSLADLFYVASGKSGLGVIFDFINTFLKGSNIDIWVMVTQIAVLLVALLSIIILISSLVIVRRKGLGKAMKAAAVINFIFAVVVGVGTFASKQSLAVGYYIVFGLTFLTMVFALVTKGLKNNKNI
ncbi:hypothetical protein EOM82_05775 [bacterium]|nr:hypothetical protein [bacterium]